ncbi:cell wall integrity protein scw1, partial [Haematococcus lacustris]
MHQHRTSRAELHATTTMSGYPDYSNYYSAPPAQPDQHSQQYGGPPGGYGAPPPSYASHAAPSPYPAPVPYGAGPHSYVLRCEMARKNMYIRNEDPALKRARVGGGGYAGTSYPPSASSAAPYRPSQPYSGSGGSPADNPPCNTLFVGNLSETVSEAELHAIFGNQPGFCQLKVVRGRNTTAFVEYDSIPSAMAVHDGPQQNAILASNADRGGIRIQYSRNPFGRKRDYAGANGPPPATAPTGQNTSVYDPLPYDGSGGPADNHAPCTHCTTHAPAIDAPHDGTAGMG